jgi:hypothetical protein
VRILLVLFTYLPSLLTLPLYLVFSLLLHDTDYWHNYLIYIPYSNTHFNTVRGPVLLLAS